ncbi:MAG TPA: hypothetical protein DCP38_03605, partial [Acidobacteria bacterium]|nr:hypothetical protein [Acidobacteriota bacterium]
GGPMARTVADAVAVFDVIAGTDPADAVTAEGDARRAERYLEFLDPNGLQGKRIGVLREMSDETADPEVIARLDEAIADLERLGATVIDPVALPADEEAEADATAAAEARRRAPSAARPRCDRFKYDLDR